MYCFANKKRLVIWLTILSLLVVFISGCNSSKKSNPVSIGDFSADTLSGGTFNQEDLAKYNLTMVNIWTTWCPYCIEEMPDLEKLYNNLPANVNMVSLCVDGKEELELAKNIIKQQSCSFTTLIPDEKLKESLLGDISGYPTTVFIDSQGNLVGKPQVGAPTSGKGIADGYLALIKERLKLASN